MTSSSSLGLQLTDKFWKIEQTVGKDKEVERSSRYVGNNNVKLE